MSCAQPLEYPICCVHCGTLNPITPEQVDYFELFNLEKSYDLDLGDLHRRYLSVSRTIHPDMIEKNDEQARENSLKLSSELNHAYEMLRDPVLRAEYLLSLAGGPAPSENKKVPGQTLSQVMMCREEIEELQAGDDREGLKNLKRQIDTQSEQALQRIAQLARQLMTDQDNDKLKTELRMQLNAVKYWHNLNDQLPVGV